MGEEPTVPISSDSNIKGERNKNNAAHEYNRQIKKNLEAIGQASNPEDFFEPCFDMAKSCLQADVMMGYMYDIAVQLHHGWSESQCRRMLSMAKEHFKPHSSTIKQNGYVLRKALEVVAALDSEFITFYTEYLTRVPGEKEPIKQVILQFVAQYGADDKSVIKYYESFFKPAYLTKWIASVLN